MTYLLMNTFLSVFQTALLSLEPFICTCCLTEISFLNMLKSPKDYWLGCLLIENPKQEYLYMAWIQLVAEFSSVSMKELLINFFHWLCKPKALTCLVKLIWIRNGFHWEWEIMSQCEWLGYFLLSRTEILRVRLFTFH